MSGKLFHNIVVAALLASCAVPPDRERPVSEQQLAAMRARVADYVAQGRSLTAICDALHQEFGGDIHFEGRHVLGFHATDVLVMKGLGTHITYLETVGHIPDCKKCDPRGGAAG